jgi:hypothetical protein
MDVWNQPIFAILGIAAIGAWVVTTWLRVRHGYPLEGSWGQQIKPSASNEYVERLRLLTAEKAQLSAELGALKDRVAVLERIATDRGQRLADEIDRLHH